jgi:hypothetical protein
MKHETEASLSGKLYFSKKQYGKARELGNDRTFAKLTNGRMVEYTELITFEQLMEDPATLPLDLDATFLGEGSFHHFTDEQGRVY